MKHPVNVIEPRENGFAIVKKIPGGSFRSFVARFEKQPDGTYLRTLTPGIGFSNMSFPNIEAIKEYYGVQEVAQ